MQQEQVDNQFRNLPIKVQKAGYTFQITKEIVQKTGLSIQEITSIINSENINPHPNQDINKDQQINVQKKRFQIIFMCLQKINIKSTTFNYHKYFCYFIKELQHIKFENTIYINFCNCNLHSLEDFRFLNAPILQTLQLFNNKIRNIKGFLKNCNLKNLASFTIYQNPIRQMIQMSRGQFPKLCYFELNISGDLTKSSIEDMFFAIKLQGKYVNKNPIVLWTKNITKIQKIKNLLWIRLI